MPGFMLGVIDKIHLFIYIKTKIFCDMRRTGVITQLKIIGVA